LSRNAFRISLVYDSQAGRFPPNPTDHNRRLFVYPEIIKYQGIALRYDIS